MAESPKFLAPNDLTEYLGQRSDIVASKPYAYSPWPSIEGVEYYIAPKKAVTKLEELGKIVSDIADGGSNLGFESPVNQGHILNPRGTNFVFLPGIHRTQELYTERTYTITERTDIESGYIASRRLASIERGKESEKAIPRFTHILALPNTEALEAIIMATEIARKGETPPDAYKDMLNEYGLLKDIITAPQARMLGFQEIPYP